MTSAEYRTLREACGLSQQAATDFHHVALRTIQHWESGRNAVPAGAADEILRLDASLERAVLEALDLYADKRAEHGAPAEVALVRYRDADAYAGSRPDREGLPFGSHGALIGRLRTAFARIGVRTSIAWA